MGIKQIQGNINVSENLTINNNIPIIVVESIDNINLETAYDGTLFFVKEDEEFLIKEEGQLNPYFPLNKLSLGFVEDLDWIEEESNNLYKYISEEEYNNLNSKDFIALVRPKRIKKEFILCKLHEEDTGAKKSRKFISDSFYSDDSFLKSLFKIEIELTKVTTEGEVKYVIVKKEQLLKPDTLQHFKKVVQGEQLDDQFDPDDVVYCTSGSIIIEPEDENSKPTGWYLVTDPSELQEEDKVIIVCNEDSVALSAQQNKNNRGQTSVSIEDDVIKLVSPDVEQFILKSKYEEENIEESEEDSSTETQNDDIVFSFYASTGTTGYLFNASSSSNYLRTQNNKDIYSNFSIVIDGSGLADLINSAYDSENPKYIRHNPSSNIFSCYKSGSEQNKVSIYKYVQGSGEIVFFDNTFITKDSEGNVKTLPNEEEIAYLNEENNKLYEYQEGQLVEISKVLELGNTSDTAYRGDYGTNNYNNIQNILNNNTTFKGNKIFSNNVTFNSAAHFNSEAEFNDNIFVKKVKTHPYSGMFISNNPDGDNESYTNYISLSDDGQITINSEEYDSEEDKTHTSSITTYGDTIQLRASKGSESSLLDLTSNVFSLSVHEGLRLESRPTSGSHLQGYQGLDLESNLSDPCSTLKLGSYGSDTYLETEENLNLYASSDLSLQNESDGDIKLYSDDYSGSGIAYYKGIEIATTTDVSNEASARQTADNNLQNQIDAIESKADVVDVVATKADLNNYDTSTLTDKDVVKVLIDESRGDATTYYRWVITSGVGAWNFIGSIGPYVTLHGTQTIDGAKSFTNIGTFSKSLVINGKDPGPNSYIYISPTETGATSIPLMYIASPSSGKISYENGGGVVPAGSGGTTFKFTMIGNSEVSSTAEVSLPHQTGIVSLASNLENGNTTGSLEQKTDSNFTFDNPNSSRTGESVTPSATGQYSFELGGKSKAEGKRAVAQGTQTIAQGNYSHAEGNNSISVGTNSHAEGLQTVADNDSAHSEGNNTKAAGSSSHAEGYKTAAIGFASHAEGNETVAFGNYSHAAGYGTYAYVDGQYVVGSFNKDENGIFIVGYGTSNADRKNAFRVCSDGSAVIAKMGDKQLSIATKGYVDSKTDFSDHITIGNTTLTEAQLIKVLALLDSLETVTGE